MLMNLHLFAVLLYLPDFLCITTTFKLILREHIWRVWILKDAIANSHHEASNEYRQIDKAAQYVLPI